MKIWYHLEKWIDVDDKESSILQSEVERTIKENKMYWRR